MTLRAADAAETGFLKSMKIDPATTETVTAMLLPPGSLVGSFPGAVTKTQLAEKLKAPHRLLLPRRQVWARWLLSVRREVKHPGRVSRYDF